MTGVSTTRSKPVPGGATLSRRSVPVEPTYSAAAGVDMNDAVHTADCVGESTMGKARREKQACVWNHEAHNTHHNSTSSQGGWRRANVAYSDG